MGKQVMAIWGVLCFVVFAAGPIWAAAVPDTGVTNCYDDGVDVIPCPSPGEPFYGQDANYTINPPSYTKLDENGNALPASAGSWAMVRDSVTGLIWEAKQNKDEVAHYDDPHDADNIYTWYEPNDPWNAGYPSEHDTRDFLDALNAAHFGGYSDWRLPTIKELAYLVDYSIRYPGPTIGATYFLNTQSYKYWSSTTDSETTDSAWSLDFYDGRLYWYYKYGNHYVRAVRGGQSPNTFVKNGNGTVTDTSSGLMWQEDTARDQEDDYDSMSWEHALAYCEDLNLGCHTDWRLPTIKEFRSLVDYTRYEPAINTTYFPNTKPVNKYWSSTTDAYRAYYGWTVDFIDGRDRWDRKGEYNYVRCVRAGNPGPVDYLDIKANGLDGPVTCSHETPVSITISLNPVKYVGFNADWWIAVKTPFAPPGNWYTYVYPTGWQTGVHRCIQTPLFEFSGFEVLKMALPVGAYTFYFAVDPPDGQATADLVDSVAVKVE